MNTWWTRRVQCAVIAATLFAADIAIAKNPFILASGRRDPRIYANRYNITSDEDLRQAVKQTTEHLAAQPAARKVVAIRQNPPK